VDVYRRVVPQHGDNNRAVVQFAARSILPTPITLFEEQWGAWTKAYEPLFKKHEKIEVIDNNTFIQWCVGVAARLYWRTLLIAVEFGRLLRRVGEANSTTAIDVSSQSLERVSRDIVEVVHRASVVCTATRAGFTLGAFFQMACLIAPNCRTT
jgi:hypothetical protein